MAIGDATHGLGTATHSSSGFNYTPRPTDVPLNPTAGYVVGSPGGVAGDQAFLPILTTNGDILIIQGQGVPSSNVGSVGDYFKDNLNSVEYGPKTDSGWGAGRSLVGPGLPPDGEEGQFVQKDGEGGFSSRWVSGYLAPLGGVTGDILAGRTGAAPAWVSVPQALYWFHVESPAYGAVGDGTTDDTAAIQAAIDAAEAAGVGSQVYFNPTKTYRITSTLTINKGIHLVGVGWGGPNGVTGQQIGITGAPRIRWFGAANGTMIRFVSSTAGEAFHGGLITGLVLDGSASAAYGLHLSSCVNTYIGNLWTHAMTRFGVWIVNDNGTGSPASNPGVLFNQIFIHDLQDSLGADSAAWGSAWTGTASQTALDFSTYNRSGLFIDGDSGGDGSVDNTAGTTVFVNCFQGEYVNGAALTITGVDTCSFGRVKAIERSGQTINGYGVHIKKALNGDFLTSKNLIKHMGRGTVYVDDDTRGNRIAAMNSEGGSVYLEGGVSGNAASFYYSMMGRINGEFHSTPTYTMLDRLPVPLGLYHTYSGSPSINGTSGIGGAGLVLPNAGAEVAWTLAGPLTWSDGTITGIRVAWMPRATSTAAVDVAVEFVSFGAGGVIGSNEAGSSSMSAEGPGTNFQLVVETVTFASPVAYSEGDLMCLNLNRNAADAFAGDIQIASIEILYESDGPSPGGGDVQNYDIPPLRYTP